MTAGEGAEGMVLSGWELDGSTRDVELSRAARISESLRLLYKQSLPFPLRLCSNVRTLNVLGWKMIDERQLLLVNHKFLVFYIHRN